jgi:hypothetical protein
MMFAGSITASAKVSLKSSILITELSSVFSTRFETVVIVRYGVKDVTV